jgi:DNA-binding NarL/FixJ family response regulator
MVVESKELARGAISAAIETHPRLRVAAEVPDLERAVQRIAHAGPIDVVVLDARAARPDIARSIAALTPPVVLIRMENGPDFVAHALALGARALARKDDAESIIDAVLTTFRGSHQTVAATQASSRSP